MMRRSEAEVKNRGLTLQKIEGQGQRGVATTGTVGPATAT